MPDSIVIDLDNRTAAQQIRCLIPGTSVTRARLVLRLTVLVMVGFGLLMLPGCASGRYLSNRSHRENALTSSLKLMRFQGPEVSKRTWTTLRRYGLVEKYTESPQICFTHIESIIVDSPDPELAHSLGELAYVEGKKAEREGRTSQALNHYGIALRSSYGYLFGDEMSEARNSYDPQFRATCELYNESLEDLLRLLCSEHQLQPGQTYTIKTENQQFVVRTEMRGGWKPDEFERYEFVSDYKIEKLQNRHTTYGLGVPLIAVRKPSNPDDEREKFYPDGLSYAVTAMMRCTSEESTAADGTPTCVLEFFDPLKANQIQLANHWVPLETDLSTPLAYFLDSPEFQTKDPATEGLLNPNESQDTRGLYMLEPYDPKRIPVLMVHGLWSSPLTWMDMFNDLRSFPEIRERYQFWFYLYPSGQPFWMSATQLRSDLEAMRETFDATHQDRSVDKMVLVGHSMGGLVSRMQTIDSGDDFWNIVSEQPPAKLQGPVDDRVKLVSALFFKPNQAIKRVVTISTPHQGSYFANRYTRWLARKFIKLPTMQVSMGQRLVATNPGLFRDQQLLTDANAIDSLAPESAIFPVLSEAKYSPDVKYHNIIGHIQNPSFWQNRIGAGDGVVSLASASAKDAVSELEVDADHTNIHMTGKAIFEVRRILLEHLKEVDADDRVAVRVKSKGLINESDDPQQPSDSIPSLLNR